MGGGGSIDVSVGILRTAAVSGCCGAAMLNRCRDLFRIRDIYMKVWGKSNLPV